MTTISDISDSICGVSVFGSGLGAGARGRSCGARSVAAADCARIGRDTFGRPTADDCGLVTALIVFEAPTQTNGPLLRAFVTVSFSAFAIEDEGCSVPRFGYS